VDAEAYFRLHARSLIVERREALELSFKELARRLEGFGIEIDAKLLAKRVNRGTFSFAFGMALLLALGEHTVQLPPPPRKGKRSTGV
jgi:hypothetical protein